MALRRLSIALLFLLGACGAEAPPVEQPTAQSETSSDEQPIMGPERRILAFGDSLFAGYNVAQAEAYPARLESALRAKGINARVANGGVSGDTTAAGRQRFEFTLDGQPETPHLVIVELGGNDLLRGLPPEETRANLAAMLDVLREREIPALLMGMQSPPNGGPEYVAAFNAIYPELAAEYDAALIPFWVEPLVDKPEQIQSDNVHPTAAGIETLVAATVDQVAEAIPDAE